MGLLAVYYGTNINVVIYRAGGGTMDRISIENKLAELERLVGAASSTEKEFAAQQLRQLIEAIEPRLAPKAPAFYDEDDLLFDNVPI